MIYKFRSAAAGDVIMMGPQGDRMLRLLGREPSAKGIIEVADQAAAIAALQAAIAAEEPPADDDDGQPAAVGLRQRLWPMIELLRRSLADGEPVVWGV